MLPQEIVEIINEPLIFRRLNKHYKEVSFRQYVMKYVLQFGPDDKFNSEVADYLKTTDTNCDISIGIFSTSINMKRFELNSSGIIYNHKISFYHPKKSYKEYSLILAEDILSFWSIIDKKMLKEELEKRLHFGDCIFYVNYATLREIFLCRENVQISLIENSNIFNIEFEHFLDRTGKYATNYLFDRLFCGFELNDEDVDMSNKINDICSLCK